MITQEQIEQLKCNLATLRGLDGGLRRAMEDIPKKDFIFLLSDGTWDNANPKQGFEYEIYRLRPDYSPKPSVVECGIFKNIVDLAYHRKSDNHSLSQAISDPDFIGFKFENGQVELSPIVFSTGASTKFCCQFRDLASLEVLHATHVLFKAVAK